MTPIYIQKDLVFSEYLEDFKITYIDPCTVSVMVKGFELNLYEDIWASSIEKE